MRSENHTMTISKGKHVTIEYQLFVDNVNGEMVEETAENNPFTFVFGEDMMLDKFEDGLSGLKAADKFSITIKCADAWGEDREDLFIEFDKKVFLDEEDGLDEEAIAEGEIVPMEDDDGNEVMGVVVENKATSIILDLNHPMAGEDVHFEGAVLEVADPQNN